MNIDPQTPWFGRKRYGWGWSPRTWQGWAIIGLYLVLSVAGSYFLLERRDDTGALVYQLALTLVVIVVCATQTGRSSRHPDAK